MIKLKKTYNRVRNDLENKLKRRMKKFIIDEHLHGRMIDGTKLPKYHPNTYKRKRRIRHFRGIPNLHFTGSLHRGIKVVRNISDSNGGVRVYIHTYDYVKLEKTGRSTKKLWEHWYLKNKRINNIKFNKIMKNS